MFMPCVRYTPTFGVQKGAKSASYTRVDTVNIIHPDPGPDHDCVLQWCLVPFVRRGSVDFRLENGDGRAKLFLFLNGQSPPVSCGDRSAKVVFGSVRDIGYHKRKIVSQSLFCLHCVQLTLGSAFRKCD